MKLKMMAVYDSASAAYLPPFVVATTAMALRQIRDVGLKQPDHDFVRHGDQFVLFDLGSFDNESGEIVVSAPVSLGTMLSIMLKADNGSAKE